MQYAKIGEQGLTFGQMCVIINDVKWCFYIVLFKMEIESLYHKRESFVKRHGEIRVAFLIFGRMLKFSAS